ncbi:MAG: hypothetical protein K2J99_17030 [Lachnospiraceae bacterium]|nr:hypothetical protein [Lachnospiraceae bacterium]
MSSSVINGAIGKSPMSDKMNQLAVKEVDIRTSIQLEQCICQSNSIKYPLNPVSFPECRKEIGKYITELRREKQDRNDNV